MRARVEAARAIQRKRFESTNLQTNSDMGPAEIRQFCPLDETRTNLVKAAMQQMQLDETRTNLVKAAMQQMQLSARAYHRTQSVKLARTIVDLAGSVDIQTVHVAEAIQYPPRWTI